MASSAEIGARMTLNSRQFLSQFSGTIDQATARARDGGRQIGAALGEEAGAGLRNLAGNIPVIGSSLTALSGPLLGVAAGVGAVSAAFALGITEAESYGDATRQLDAVLKATGNTTGLTSQQLRDFADELEGSFAIGAEEILKAEQVLSSFGGVAGSTFTDAIRLAGDLSAVYGGDLSSNSEKLGTVLQNLAQGSVDGLSKGFKFLGVAQIEAIEALAKSGQTYEAQRALLDALKNTVGGAGEANAGGLSGAFFRLKDAFGDGARQLATDTGAYEGAIGALDGMTSAVERNLNALERIRRDGIGTEFVRELRELAGLPVGADAPRVAAAKPFTASDRARVGLGGVDDIAARAAADTARAEGDAARATEALAAAAKKVADEQERAGKAVLAQEKALRDLIADAEFQASLAFKTKDAAEQLLAIRRAERAVGRELTAQERDRLLIAGERARLGPAGAGAGDQAGARGVAR
uniref:phage tail length tape measure family protein n=1 Tax=Sandarakinorhabdus sp. TaxID=1916663 RepID=UPI00286E402C